MRVKIHLSKMQRLAIKIQMPVALIAAKFAISLLPFSLVRRMAGLDEPSLGDVSKADSSRMNDETAIAYGRLITSYNDQAIRWLPLKFLCFPQAMAARWILSQHGVPSRIVIGARAGTAGTGGGAYDLHAWLVVRRVCVMGGQDLDGFKTFENPGSW